MKKLLFIICIAVCTCSAFSQTTQQIIDSAKACISREQYLSAFSILEQTEESNANLVVAVASLINDYQTGFTVNLDQWKLDDKVNGKAVKSEFVKVPLENILWSAAGQYPTDCRIHKEIYKLYVYVFKHRGAYLELKMLGELNNAIEKQLHPQCPDYRSLYIMGYCYNAAGRLQTAIGNLQKAIAGNTKFAPAYLELGKVYLQASELPNAIKQANTAFELYTEKSDKSRAALLAGQAYEANNENAKALNSYLLADSLYRKEFFTQRALLNMYVKTSNENAPKALNSFVGAQGRDNLYAYMDACDIYLKHNHPMDLALYCQKALADYKGRTGVESCLNFTLGLIYKSINPDMARQYFKKAKEQGLEASRFPPKRNHPDTAKRIEEAFKWVG
ncbi:tetratricopeptide (TPR) repeat protein [Filimonas zeae]|uniref:Tetratricopeptide repeat-containing protein n=1 Tax=Filimonas zeae TaxID=1737353 RepID=A0A917MUT0_9BACT|nr:hypothetical protein [Filimonas zeae]MDR6338107.1 tetratricopeptide (TPR) repeat protein [Filimonas zeae]GGH61746.1 hypothetical protein GCM10011379_11040 [Filimonas zeae]